MAASSQMNKQKDLVANVISRFESLRAKRQNWENHWLEGLELAAPESSRIYSYTMLQGDKRRNKVYDATAEHSIQLLASALHSSLTNPTTEFFALSTGDSEFDRIPSIREYLQKVSSRIHRVLNDSNFHSEVHKIYKAIVGPTGTGVLRTEEDDDHVVRFHSRPIYECYIEESSKGSVDVLYRTYPQSLRQIRQEYGEDVIEKNSSLKKQFTDNPHKDVTVIHAVFPKDQEAIKGMTGKASFPFASIYAIKEEGILLEEDGFREFPYLVPRWDTAPGEVYARSPTMKALPDIKMINQVMKTTIRSAQKIVDPPLIVSDDGVLLPLKTNPGGINYARPSLQNPIQPLETRGRVDFGFQLIDDLKTRIRQHFFVDQLQLVQNDRMTATEVQERSEEKMRLLGPVLARMQFEFLRPLVDRVFNIMQRKDLLPEPPDELQRVLSQGKREIGVQYTSTIARVQKTLEARNFLRAMETLTPVLQAEPQAIDIIDGDKTARGIFEIYGVDETYMRDAEQVSAIRNQRQKQQAQAERLAAQKTQAETVKDLGQGAKAAREGQNISG